MVTPVTLRNPRATYAHAVVQTATEAAPAGTGMTRRAGRFGLLVGLVLGYLGWVLPTPGEPILTPTLVVAATGAAIGGLSWFVACFKPAWRDLWTFAVAVFVLTVAASFWTFEFSLPAAMAWDSSATQRAQSALLQLQHEPTNPRGTPLYACTKVETGSIGPLDAPYTECAVSNPQGHFVTYTVLGPGPASGVGYTDIGAATFPDECSRHLVGRWWMFGPDPDGGCPMGYQFHGGG
jgi:hypothetical protein